MMTTTTRQTFTRTLLAVGVVCASVLTSLPVATGGVLESLNRAPSWVHEALGTTDYETAGAGVTVAVVSDGLQLTHPEFHARVLPGWDTTLGRAYRGSTEPLSGGVFGTFAAGLIAAADDGAGITGIAPQVKLLPVRVESPWRSGDRYTAEGIDWAVGHGADVIAYVPGLTIARSADTAQLTCQAISRAKSRGIAVFTPVVNDAASMDFFDVPFQPALCDGAVAIAGIDERFADALGAAPVGPAFFAVPAVRLRSTSNLHGSGGYQTTDGSVFAGALGAGAAAVVVGQYGRSTVEALLQVLERASVDIGTSGYDPLTGAGIPYLSSALSGEPVPTADVLRTRIVKVTSPRILTVDAVNATSTQIGWEPPAGTEVTSYVVTARFTEAGAERVVKKKVSMAQERLTIAVAPSRSAVYTVTALTQTGPRVSDPMTDSMMIHGRVRVTSHRAISAVTATWVERGVQVVVNRTVAASGSAWEVDVIDAVDGRSVVTSSRASKHQVNHVVTLAANARERSTPLVVVARIGKRTESVILAPQYPITATARVSQQNVLVTGSIDAACRVARERACSGTTVLIIDPSTGLQLASTTTTGNGLFATALTCRKNMPSVMVKLPTGERSQPVRFACR
jgi:hypothetical protein